MKPLLALFAIIAAAVVFVLLARPHEQAASVDDLASSDQATRDKAAAQIRATYRPIPETKWKPVIDQIHKGQTKKEIDEILSPFHVTEIPVLSGQSPTGQSYRLDDEWVLRCFFLEDDTLFVSALDPSMKQVLVEPSRRFTGLWTVYYINGQKCDDIPLKNERIIGEYIHYHPNGSMQLKRHHTAEGLDGTETEYYPSGKIARRGQYKSDERVGTWTWYDETGKVISKREYY